MEVAPLGGECVVLSPHPDDAVLSTWHAVVADVDVRVVTVCAGVPKPGFVTALDRARGATESAALMRRRRDDDRAALALAGRVPAQLDLLDADYRAFQVPELRRAIERDPSRFLALASSTREIAVSPEELERAVGRWLSGHLLYAPLGIGGHPDHRDLARLAQQLAQRGRRIRFYADFPYLVRHGPPSWLGGGEDVARADAQVDQAFAALPAKEHAFERTVVELEPAQIELKIAAFARYETEFALVDADFRGAVRDPILMGREVYWTPRPLPT